MSNNTAKLPWHPIPISASTCKVYLMQAGGLYIPTDMVLLPGPDNSDESKEDKQEEPEKTFYAPDYVFLIEHTATGNKYIFDLGMRKDLENLPPLLVNNVLPRFKCEPKDPADILRAHGTPQQQPEKIKAVIFSHEHFDHVGAGAVHGFDDAEMWIGPTCCTYARPGYPVDPKAPTLSETLPTDGSRKIVEAYISDELLEKAGDARVGRVQEGMRKGQYAGTTFKKPDWIGLGAFDRAFDVFEDGSAYIIDAPGHSAGHQMMLIRTSTKTTTTTDAKQDAFVLLAGDCYHHPDLLRDPRRTARPPYAKESMHSEPEVAVDTMFRTRALAEKENIWVLGAHDGTVGEGMRKGEKEIEGLVEVNGWEEKGWKKPLR